MNKKEFVVAYRKAVEMLGLPSSKVIATSGGALLMLGLRDETDDLDLDIPKSAFDVLANIHPVKMFGGNKVVDICDKVSVHIAECNIETIVTPEGVTIPNLDALLQLKLRISKLPERNAAKVAIDKRDISKLQLLISGG